MNIKYIYQTEEGDVTEIISMEDAITQQCYIAKNKGHQYLTNKEAMMDLLQCPCTEITDEPIGKTVIPRVLTLEEAMAKIDELHDYIEDLEDTKVDINGSTSDGYHTFDELYEHRCTLFVLCMNLLPELSWYSHMHEDETSWDGWIICGIDLPDEDTITYHIPLSMVHLLKNVKQLIKGKKWDGHTAEDVLSRIRDYIEYDLDDTKEVSLNMYRITNTGGGWDTYDSAIVVATDEDSARDIKPGYSDQWEGCSSVTFVGKASSDFSSGDIVLSSFNAG